MYINMEFLGLDLSNTPKDNYKDIKTFIIPFLYVITSIISIKLTNKTKKVSKYEKEKEKNVDEEESLKTENNGQFTIEGKKNKIDGIWIGGLNDRFSDSDHGILRKVWSFGKSTDDCHCRIGLPGGGRRLL